MLLAVYNLLLIGGLVSVRIFHENGNWNMLEWAKWTIWTKMYTVYILYEFVCILLDIRYTVLYWFMYHLLPFITLESLDQINTDNLDEHKINECVFQLIWDRTEKMMDDIDTFKEVQYP